MQACLTVLKAYPVVNNWLAITLPQDVTREDDAVYIGVHGAGRDRDGCIFGVGCGRHALTSINVVCMASSGMRNGCVISKRLRAIAAAMGLISKAMKSRPSTLQARGTVPPPQKGSNTVSPGKVKQSI